MSIQWNASIVKDYSFYLKKKNDVSKHVVFWWWTIQDSKYTD